MSLISGSESKIFAKGVIGNVRKAQEDSHGMRLGTPNGDLFVVCDGMGGHVGGAMASRIAVDSIVEYIGKEHYATPVVALDGALQFANMQILGYANEHPEYRGMGTTACIVLIRDTDVWIAHVGDSRIYLYLGKEKELHRITKDHSFVQTLVDAGEITDEEAEHHPNKNRILKALGIKPELYPTFNFEDKPIFVKNGDIFLICSDGLSGMIPDSTIDRVLGEKLTLQERGDKLIELAMQGETVQPGGQDNCTVELIEIDQAVGKDSVFHSYNPYRAPKEPEKKGRNTKKMIRIALIVLGALVVIFGALIVFKPKLGTSNKNQHSKPVDTVIEKAATTSHGTKSSARLEDLPNDSSKFECIKNEMNNWDKNEKESEVKKLEEDYNEKIKRRMTEEEFNEMRSRWQKLFKEISAQKTLWESYETKVFNWEKENNTEINKGELKKVKDQLEANLKLIRGKTGWITRLNKMEKLNLQNKTP